MRPSWTPSSRPQPTRSFLEGMAKDDFLADKRPRQAVIMSLIVIGEAATKVMDGYAEFTQSHADVPWRSILLGADSKVYEVAVKPGDSLDKIAKVQGSTVDTLRKLNPTAAVLRPGQMLKYQKASMQRVVTSWRNISTATIAQRYNGGGDPNYAKKLDHALSLIRKGKAAVCAQ